VGSQPRLREFDALLEKVSAYGVRVTFEEMDVEVPGRFDGRSITINPVYDRTSRCYYLAHSFGSIVAWSEETDEAHRGYHELREARNSADSDPRRLDRAIAWFRNFEEIASEYAVSLLMDAGVPHLIDGYTEFFRADCDSMEVFHRTGAAPRWPEFFAAWKSQAARGEKQVARYAPRPIPAFEPVLIRPDQEVIQEQDGHP
jgi:hypothetical protein